ncbi:MAG TPA: hypothetical protein VH186_33750 [Chloroflexia bacterium]|nr:hypothetical protein [Chloroflexia bacterium]
MFAGHYGASLALKKIEKDAPLGQLFLAAQFIDVLWGGFVLAGVERVEVAPQLPSSPLIMSFIPFTHSLPGALFWSGLVWLIVRFLPVPLLRAAKESKTRNRVALALSAGVFSHWLLDLLVHRPDLGLIGNEAKVGLSLYDYPFLAFSLEALVLVAGMGWYLRSTKGSGLLGKYGMVFFGGFLLLVNALTYWGPVPPQPWMIAIFNEVFYFSMALIAGWLGKKRVANDEALTKFKATSSPFESNLAS